MNACNSEFETLIVVAKCYNFKKVEQLENILQDGALDLLYKAQKLREHGDYQGALCILTDLYEKRKFILGSNNPGTLQIEFFIATSLLELGSYDQALYKLEQIYQKQKEILGLRNKETLYTRTTIASVLYAQDRNEEALEIYQEVYQNQKEILGSNHLDILGTEHDMALVLNALGRYEEALNINKKIYKENIRRLGTDHPATVRVQNNIALVLASQGNHEQSLKIYREVLEKKKKNFGLYHTETLRTVQSIAATLLEQDKYPEALKLYQEVLDIQKTVLQGGLHNPETLRTQYGMGRVLFQQGKFANALKVFSECFEPIKTVFGHNHEFVSDISKILKIIEFRFKFEDSSITNILKHMEEDMKTVVKNGDIETIIRLLKNGVDINEKDNYGMTALHYSVNFKQIEIFNVLLQNGADIFQITTNKGNTPLHLATLKGNQEMVEVLLQHVPHKKLNAFINARTTSGNTTALHVAAKNGSLNILKILLKNGAMYDIKNNDGKKPLDLSTNQRVERLLKIIENLFEDTKSGNVEVVKKLESLNGDEFFAVMNSRNSQGNTLLQIAKANKDLKLVGRLSEMLELFKD